MDIPVPESMPDSLREFLERALPSLTEHSWLVGIAAGGSFATGQMDEFSDLDLLLIVEDERHAEVMEERPAIAGSLGPLLTSFSGEHVGQPRLLQCLYGPPLIHVDFVFDTMGEASERVEKQVVLWERDEILSKALNLKNPHYFFTPMQWHEDRFWVWVHKAAGAIGRGEILEAIEYLGFLRNRVLAPLVWSARGKRPRGLRGVENVVSKYAKGLRATVAGYNAKQCLIALRATVKLYCRLRQAERNKPEYRVEAEGAVRAYLDEIEAKLYASKDELPESSPEASLPDPT